MLHLVALCWLAAVTSWLVLGCSGPPELAARPPSHIDSLPPDVRHVADFFEGAGGVRIFRQSWRSTHGARATLVIHHGLKSHSEHYRDFALRLVARGFAVYALDMRGHGRSAGPRGTLDDFDDLVGDLDALVTHARTQEANAPIFVAGHSVGGAVVTLYALERKPHIAGLILLAPAIRVDRMPFEAGATSVAAALLPNFKALDVPDTYFSRDPAVVADMARDPLVHHEPGPARTVSALLAALTRIWSAADELNVPLLALHGTGDLATDPRGSAELVRRCRHPDRKLLLYRGLYHDLIREPERDQVMTDIENWLEERAPRARAEGG